MKVTALEKQKNNPDRFSVFIDGGYTFSAEAIDIVKYTISVNNELSEEELSNLIFSCEASKAQKYALDLISRRDYTASEVTKKLIKHEFNTGTIENTIEKLKELGLLNDINYVDRYINDGINLKKQGKKKIMYDLSQKGICKTDLENVEIDSEIEYSNAVYLGEKKYSVIKNKVNAKEKLFRYLISKGYDYDISKKVVNGIIKKVDEFIES